MNQRVYEITFQIHRRTPETLLVLGQRPTDALYTLEEYIKVRDDVKIEEIRVVILKDCGPAIDGNSSWALKREREDAS